MLSKPPVTILSLVNVGAEPSETVLLSIGSYSASSNDDRTSGSTNREPECFQIMSFWMFQAANRL